MDNKMTNTSKLLDDLFQKTSVAQIGGFRLPDSPITSWFGETGFGLLDATLPYCL